MEDAEEIIDDLRMKLDYRMEVYNLTHLNSGNLKHHGTKMAEREQVLEELSLATGKFMRKFSSQLSQERVDEIKGRLSTKKTEFIDYRESFSSKVTELESLSINNSSPPLIPSINNLLACNTVLI